MNEDVSVMKSDDGELGSRLRHAMMLYTIEGVL